MSRNAAGDPENGMTEIFVSYSPADERWATWMAWELEAAGYRTMLQAWDFVPGTNFIDFMDRGLSRAAAVVAVLSRHYLDSTYGRLEWQATLRASPGNPATRLVPVRVEDCEVEGLLATITYLDLAGVADPERARDLLLGAVRQTLAGRAKQEGGYPHPSRTVQGQVLRPAAGPQFPAAPRVRRTPARAPVFPPAVPEAGLARTQITLLHVAAPRFGRGLAAGGHLPAADLQARIWADVTRLTAAGAARPDVMVVTGDLTESGTVRQYDEARSFLTGLRALIGLEPHRVAIVPGAHDITPAASRAYFAACEADDVEPQPPFWPKWRHYANLFSELYRDVDGPVFDSSQPWTLFPIPDLRVVVAGLNSTMAVSHRPDDDYGWIGEAQAAWFAERLDAFEKSGWLRVGAIRHDPMPGAAPAGRDPSLLRDPGTLDQLLGPRLNLLLHGPGPGGDEASELGSGLLVVPAAASGTHQFLQITPAGLDRWDARRIGGDPERRERRWHATGGTFSAGDGESAAEDEAPSPGLLERQRSQSPASLLLDRITEVCETRHPGARIRKAAEPMPHLRLTYSEDGIVRQWQVGAHVGEPDGEDLAAFLQLVHTGQPDAGPELVYDGPQPPLALREEALRRGVRLRSFLEFQGLLDLRGYVARQTARLAADRRYPPGLYVPQRFHELDDAGAGVRDDLVDELLRQVAADHGRFLLVLGDFGRGKTFALREAARRIPVELPHLIPILIELRALDKAHSVEGLVAAHLANHGEDVIDLRAFRYMLREGRIVLLFDGFDELVSRVTYERAADHLQTLLRAAEDKAKIVVASRTQHFKSAEQVLTALGERVSALPSQRVLAIEDFSPSQVRSYLVGRYDGDEGAAERRLGLLGEIGDLLGLSSNPRMLSFLAELDEDRLRAVAGTGQAISAASLYEEILEAWLRYEEERTHSVPGAPGGLRLDGLWRAVTTMALRLWESGEPFLRLTELTEIAAALSDLADGRLSAGQRAHAMGSGSLLIRTDAGLFGFIHASVVEWLVAAEIARQLTGADAQPAPLAVRPLTQLTVDFLCDLADAHACQVWIARTLADPRADEVARVNAIKLSTRLRTSARTDLRGALLRGEDLSHRDLEGADLTGADLTDARLVGTDLAGATLARARLAGARLDDARLTGADLTGADLSRARLARADLRGARLAGSRWVRAALIDVTADPGLANAPELRGAAIAPGQPIEVEFAPAAVSVPYGFHYQGSRLPEPLAYSADGSLLAVGGEDGGVAICDTYSGLPVRTLHGHHGRVYAVAFSADGRVLATGSSDGAVRLWDPATGDLLHTLEGHRAGAWPVALSRSGTRLVTGDGDGLVRVWDVGAGRVTRRMPGHAPPVYTAAFSPDGSLLAVGDTAAARVYDLADEAVVRELPGHRGPVYRATFSPDGTLLATADHSGTVRLWDPAAGHLRHELAGHSGRVYTIAFHPDGSLLASGDTEGRIGLWDPRTGKADGELAGHRAAVYWVAFSPGGETVASCDSAGNVVVWDLAARRRAHRLAGHRASVWPMAFRPDGAQLATCANDGTARLWDTVTGQCRHLLRGHGRRITGVRFSPAGDLLATCGNDGVVRLWEPHGGRLLRHLTGTSDRLISVLFAPVADRLATASNDGGIYLWNARSGDYEREMNVETDHVWAEAFSPDGDVLATANDDDSVRLWYCPTGRQVRALTGHRGRVRAIAFSPDGAVVATGCDDRVVRLWDAATGTCLASLTGHVDRVYSVHFSPDGRLLASASNDGTAWLWDVASATAAHTLARHQGRLWSAAFSPDGSLLATAGDDLVIHLWDPRTGAHRHALAGHTRRVWSVSFSPDGTLLASGGDDGAVGLWRISGEQPPRLMATLLGLPEGWAALAPDGRYKQDGNVAGQFWHAIGMCRFGSGELDPYLPAVRRLPLDAPF